MLQAGLAPGQTYQAAGWDELGFSAVLAAVEQLAEAVGLPAHTIHGQRTGAPEQMKALLLAVNEARDKTKDAVTFAASAQRMLDLVCVLLLIACVCMHVSVACRECCIPILHRRRWGTLE